MHRLTEALDERGIRYQLLPHRAAETAVEEAVALAIPPREVLKTVVVDFSGGHAAAVLLASRRLDLAKLRQALGDPAAEMASEREIVRDLHLDPAAIPPIPSLLGMPVFVDPEVMHEREVVAADTGLASVRTTPAELFRGEQITVTPVTIDWS